MNKNSLYSILVLEPDKSFSDIISKKIDNLELDNNFCKIKYDICDSLDVAKIKMLNSKYDLVISSFYFNNETETGLDFVNWIKCELGILVPVVIVTSIKDYEVHKNLIQSGVESIFLKPLNGNFQRGLKLLMVKSLILREEEKNGVCNVYKKSEA